MQLTRFHAPSHEAVYGVDRPDLGVAFFAAIHSTALGPAFGGARMWGYLDEASALRDALRLSEGMTYKNAVARLGVGGGKSVIWVKQPEAAPREAIFTAFGEFVEAIGGRYITAEDVGTSVADMQTVRRVTANVAGLPPAEGRAGGDPSPWTALGVFCAIEQALAFRARRLDGARVAVQGCGAVGAHLCDRLAEGGARLVVADLVPERAAAVAARTGAETVGLDEILFQEADVLAPCALGAALNAETIPSLRAGIVAGAANNQLAEPGDGAALAARGVLYVPDYVANAGGIICALAEYREEPADSVEAQVRAIGPRVRRILDIARATGKPPHEVAKGLAEELLSAARDPSPARYA